MEVEIDSRNHILIDPGIYSKLGITINNLKFIIFTHHHPDHFDLRQLETITQHNPQAKIFGTPPVQQALSGTGLTCTPVNRPATLSLGSNRIEIFQNYHQPIFPNLPLVPNLSVIVNRHFLLPGDSYFKPELRIDTLALPVCAPWLKVSESLAWALQLSPQKVLPIHDGFLSETNGFYSIPKQVLAENGIVFLEPLQDQWLEI